MFDVDLFNNEIATPYKPEKPKVSAKTLAKQQAKAQSDALEMDREYQEHCEHFFKGKPHKRHRLLGK